MSDTKTIVNSWNEWDPLKHVIVGRADGTCIPAPEPALDAKVPEDSDMRGQFGPRTKDTVDKANQLLDDFSNMLQKRGVKVDRPTPIDFNQKTSTPDWEAETMFGCMPPRDVLLTVGNEILEATMSYRCRWFEYLCYRPLLQEYYNEDPNMRHESAPKPRLTDKDYRKDYLSDKIGIQKRLEWTEDKFFVTTEEEPLFDAADVLRFGKDLVVQHGFTTNLKGIDWLKRHYKDHRVHAVNFPGDLISVKEDVGRHNALDKLIGYTLFNGQINPLTQFITCSGRLNFELVQKVLMTDIGIMIGVGAPTSLAIDLANKFDITLIGFVKRDSFNIYTNNKKVIVS
ncbi:formate dehydrogenase accessory sulfurtransferase FdhD [Candidatus Pelagibacter sp.]|nr:formate dehydrogenase accessory sulfurtransferase FdhD [Candidatus Pelagibacter sp.]